MTGTDDHLLLLGVVAAILLAGCTTAPDGPGFGEVEFQEVSEGEATGQPIGDPAVGADGIAARLQLEGVGVDDHLRTVWTVDGQRLLEGNTTLRELGDLGQGEFDGPVSTNGTFSLTLTGGLVPGEYRFQLYHETQPAANGTISVGEGSGLGEPFFAEGFAGDSFVNPGSRFGPDVSELFAFVRVNGLDPQTPIEARWTLENETVEVDETTVEQATVDDRTLRVLQFPLRDFEEGLDAGTYELTVQTQDDERDGTFVKEGVGPIDVTDPAGGPVEDGDETAVARFETIGLEGSSTFRVEWELENETISNELVTLSDVAEFDGDRAAVTIDFSYGWGFDPGDYTVRLYQDNLLVQREPFQVGNGWGFGPIQFGTGWNDGIVHPSSNFTRDEDQIFAFFQSVQVDPQDEITGRWFHEGRLVHAFNTTIAETFGERSDQLLILDPVLAPQGGFEPGNYRFVAESEGGASTEGTFTVR